VTLLKTTLMASVVFASAALTSAMAQAEDSAFLGGTVSANVAMKSEYRFRGVSLTDRNFALQGGFDYSHDSGFYVGTWASNLAASDTYGEIELDVYGGYGGEINGISYDVGALLYAYPTGRHIAKTDYLELYGSLGVDLGVASAKIGAAYALSSQATGHQDNLYLYTDVEGVVPNTPATIAVHLGYENGAFGNKKLDWSLGASVNYSDLDFGVTYVDTDQIGRNFKGAVIFSVGASF